MLIRESKLYLLILQKPRSLIFQDCYHSDVLPATMNNVNATALSIAIATHD